ASSQRKESDAQLVELRQIRVRRELGIEDEMARLFTVVLLPEAYEPKYFIRFFALSQVGVRVAEHLTFGVLREERQDCFPPLAPPWDVVLLDEGIVTEVRDRVKIEIEGARVDQLLVAQPFDPASQQPRDGLAAEARRVLRHERRLGDRVQ